MLPEMEKPGRAEFELLIFKIWSFYKQVNSLKSKLSLVCMSQGSYSS